jgi:hypothetical protein
LSDYLGAVPPHQAPKVKTGAMPADNVILDLGYFIGKLGRKNVCAIKIERRTRRVAPMLHRLFIVMPSEMLSKF